MSRLSRRLLGRRGLARPLFEPADLGDFPTASGFSQEYLLRRTRPIPVLDRPHTVPARDLAMPPDELVLGAGFDGEARVYPTSTLRRNHLVNDEVLGEAFLATFCGKCFAGVGFHHRVDGRTLAFEVFGAYRGSVALQDRETEPIALLGADGFWPLAYRRWRLDRVVELRSEGELVVDQSGGAWNLDGRPAGALAAEEGLAYVPSAVMEWHAWSAHHPSTDVASAGASLERG